MKPLTGYWEVSLVCGRAAFGGRYDGILCRYRDIATQQLTHEVFDTHAKPAWDRIRETNTVTDIDYAADLMADLHRAEAFLYCGLDFVQDERGGNQMNLVYELVDTSESNETSGTDA